MKKAEKWWENYHRNGKVLSRRKAISLLLPRNRSFQSKYRRWIFEDILSWIVLAGGTVFITIVALIGDKNPSWGIEVAMVAVVILMVVAIVFLIGHRIERMTVLNSSYYRRVHEDALVKIFEFKKKGA